MHTNSVNVAKTELRWTRIQTWFGLGLLLVLAVPSILASENVPCRPFAQWADLPEPGQFIAGVVYEESEAYHIWAGRNYQDITTHSGGENYGIDINQGFLSLQYGIAEKWAADLNVGATTLGWRSFSPGGEIQSTTGLMDLSFGVRYQVFNEAKPQSPWLPTLTVRAGAVLPGSYDQDIAFAPGLRSAAIQPEVLLRPPRNATCVTGSIPARFLTAATPTRNSGSAVHSISHLVSRNLNDPLHGTRSAGCKPS